MARVLRLSLLYFFWVLLNLTVEVFSASCKFKGLSCESLNKSKIEFRYCRIEPFSNWFNTLNMDGKLNEVINKVTVRVKLLKRENGWKPFLYDFTVNACKFFQARHKYPLAAFFWNNIEPFTNINHTCPFDHDIFVKKFILTNDSIRLSIPYGEYIVDTFWIANGKPTAQVNASVSFTEF